MNENLFKLEAKIKGMAKRLLLEKVRGYKEGSGKQDAILRIPIAFLILEESISEKYDEVKDLTDFEVSDEGEPKACGFKEPERVEAIQEEITELKEKRKQIEAQLTALEEIFQSYGAMVCSMSELDNLLNEKADLPRQLAIKINREVRHLLDSNPAMLLAEIWSAPTVMELESTRSKALGTIDSEVNALKTLKEEVNAISRGCEDLVKSILHPRRVVLDPARVSEMLAA